VRRGGRRWLACAVPAAGDLVVPRAFVPRSAHVWARNGPDPGPHRARPKRLLGGFDETDDPKPSGRDRVRKGRRFTSLVRKWAARPMTRAVATRRVRITAKKWNRALETFPEA